jgi:hypothetical protein
MAKKRFQPPWHDNVSRVKTVFDNSILPELLGKWFSRPPPASAQASAALQDSVCESQAGNSSEVYCYCGGPDVGDMIGCDHKECIYKWFHLSCLKLKTFPRSKMWYCPDCRKLKKK